MNAISRTVPVVASPADTQRGGTQIAADEYPVQEDIGADGKLTQAGDHHGVDHAAGGGEHILKGYGDRDHSQALQKIAPGKVPARGICHTGSSGKRQRAPEAAGGGCVDLSYYNNAVCEGQGDRGEKKARKRVFY